MLAFLIIDLFLLILGIISSTVVLKHFLTVAAFVDHHSGIYVMITVHAQNFQYRVDLMLQNVYLPHGLFSQGGDNVVSSDASDDLYSDIIRCLRQPASNVFLIAL